MSFHIKCSANARYLDTAPLYTGIHYELAYHRDGRSQVSIPNVPPIWPNLKKGRTTVEWTWWRHRNANNKVCPPQSDII